MSTFYVKNVPQGERVLRVVVGVAVAVAAVVKLGGWLGLAVAAGAAGIVVSGLVGFCPACAMLGRRLKQDR
jgi:hypothetical protein